MVKLAGVDTMQNGVYGVLQKIATSNVLEINQKHVEAILDQEEVRFTNLT